MLPSPTRSREHLVAIGRVKNWTRKRFSLPDEAVVTVSEVRCALPGCPPVETIVAFWTEGAVRHRLKLFKPVAEVSDDDLPPKWLLNALVDDNDLGCDCC
jgi:nitrate reductase delta subunit